MTIFHNCDGHSHDNTEHGDDGPGIPLRSSIDFPNVICLNEEREHAGRSILKLHEERLTATPFLSSPPGDPELLLIVPFVESVSILSITIQSTISNTTSTTTTVSPPRTIRLFTNRDDLDFETARELPPQMELQLVSPDHYYVGEGTTIDYPCRPAGRFQNITCLALLVVDNFHHEENQDECSTIITYIGFKGKSSNVRRRAVEAVYETQGMPADHVANMEETHSFVG
jgi:hypothetical protein